MAKPELAVSNKDPEIVDFAQVLEDFRKEFGDEGPTEPTQIELPVKHRHQLMHMDFWFVTAALACQLLIMTSFMPIQAFEPLVVASIFFLFCAVVSNLTREKQGVVVVEFKNRLEVAFSGFSWPKIGYVPAKAPVRDNNFTAF